MCKLKQIGLAALLMGMLVLPAQSQTKNIFSWRSIQWPTASGTAMATPEFRGLLKRMNAVGYNAMFLDGAGLLRLHEDPKVVAACKAFNAEAKRNGILLVFCSQYQTGSPQMPQHLREALPNEKTRFVVQNGVATVKGNPSLAIKNPGFEGSLDSWGNTGRRFVIDHAVWKSGTSSARCSELDAKLVLLKQTVKVKPRQTYELSAWVQSQGIEHATPRWQNMPPMSGTMFTVFANGQYLLCNREWSGVGKNSKWKQFKQRFYSKNHSSVEVFLNATYYYQLKGTIWFDDVAIREVGLEETVNRVNMPVVVKTTGGKTLTEGKDYVVGVGKLTIPAGSSVKNGDELLVDWYTSGNMFSKEAEAAFCYKEVWDGMREQVRVEDDAFGDSPAKLMKYDEWRLGGWDPQCIEDFNIASEGSGRYFAHVANMTAQIYKEANSNRIAFAYSDMYDPFHNAKPVYKMVNGGLLGAGHHLSEDIVIFNWNPSRRKSTLYFAGMDPTTYGEFGVKKTRHKQLLSTQPNGISAVLKDITSMEENDNLPDDAIIGINYVRWEGGIKCYGSQVETFAQTCQASGRWGTSGIADESPTTASNLHLSLAAVSGEGGAVRELAFSVPANNNVRLSIINLHGQRVSIILDEQMAAGTYERKIDMSRMAPGVYFARLVVAGSETSLFPVTRKLVVF